MKNPVVLLTCLLASVTPVFTSADVKWLSTEYYFGAFKEAEGPKMGSVRFVNTGKEPTFIRNVRPSCGCTGVEYTEDMIQPGDTATVGFTYNPAGRPGPFDKTVKVYIGSDNQLEVIRITGTVIGSPETLEVNYPHEVGPLRFESFLVPMGEVKKGGSRHAFVNVYNQGSDTIRPVWTDKESAIETNFTPKALAPGEIGTFGFYLNTSKEKRMGPVEYVVSVRPDNRSPQKAEHEIKITSSIVPDSQSLSVEDIENSPRAYLDPEFIDLGESLSEEAIPFEFGILNDGKAKLEVNRVYSNNEGVELNTFSRSVKGKDKGKVQGKLDTHKLPPGPFRIRVEVITNDPLHPVRTANLVGIIKK